MQYTVKRNDETLDAIVYKQYGSSFAYLELVLAANQFLYEEECFLKVGLSIELPQIIVEPKSRVTLWN
jgi:phage tail protein X